MLGPRLPGENGVALAPPALADHLRFPTWAAQPELTYYWGPRAGEWTAASIEERFAKVAARPDLVEWAITVDGATVGLTGIEDIDWIRRQGESYIIVGERSVQRRGVASEAVRLRTAFAFRELNLHRVYNWIAYDNVGSRRANEKGGYVPQGIRPRAFRRGPRVHDEWLGEVLRRDWERRQRA